MSDNDDNNDDSNNPNEQSEPSKLPKPASLDHFFNKIDNYPKLVFFQTKIKPNPTDKIPQHTKISYKTTQDRVQGNSWVNNSRMKFEMKEGKTKLSISKTMFERERREDKNFKKRNSEIKKNENINDKPQNEKEKIVGEKLENQSASTSQIREEKSKIQKKQSFNSNQGGPRNFRENNQSHNLDFSFSTAYDNSKLNLRIRDRGQILLKMTQTIDLIPNSLKTQLQYLLEHKNKNEQVNKYSLELFYTTGLNRWVHEVLRPEKSLLSSEDQNIQNIQEKSNKNENKLRYQKNETKVKVKVSNHGDPEIKFNSLNHFGQIRQISSKQSRQNKSQKPQTIQPIESQPIKSQQTNSPNIFQHQILKTKVELENKLTFSSKPTDQFNFKSFFNFESVSSKQLFKIETIVNRFGLHNFETRYVCKSWGSYIFGGMLGFNWNSHNSEWHKKWEVIFEKQGLFRQGNLLLSVSDKCTGMKFVKKYKQIYKIELMASKKWNSGNNLWPNFGVKINLNW